MENVKLIWILVLISILSRYRNFLWNKIYLVVIGNIIGVKYIES